MSQEAGQRVVAGFIGKSGSGKSTLLRAYTQRSRRLLVADVKKDWVPGPGDQLITSTEGLLQAAEKQRLSDPRIPFRIVYRASIEEMQVVPARFALAIQHLTLLLDEAALFCTASHMPPAVRDFVITSRHVSCNLLYATTRPQHVATSFHDEADVIHFFRIERGAALQRIRRDWPDLADQLPALPVPPKGGSRRKITGNFRIYGNVDSLRLIGREGVAR